MTAQEYITAALHKLAQPVEPADIDDALLEETILSKVMSKKFRKLKADQVAIDHAKTAISRAVKAGKPLRLTLHFGGNKLWRLKEAPGIDWGELFSLIYYANWAKSIASVYKPGAIFEYFSMDICVERMNNVPHEETDVYSKQLTKLMNWAETYMPKGVSLRYTRYGDAYENREAFYKELDQVKQAWLTDNNGKLPELSDAQKAATELNVKLKPGQDKDPQWRERVEWEHQSLFGTQVFRDVETDPDSILNCPTWYTGYIATGSTRRSLAKFWAGVGALEPAGDGYNQIIVTPKQLKKFKFDWESVSIPGLEGDNFKRIRIVKSK
jgi:hypothetical protein